MKIDYMKSILLPFFPYCITFFSEQLLPPSATVYAGFILLDVKYGKKSTANKYKF